jgi:hypothetical protein
MASARRALTVRCQPGPATSPIGLAALPLPTLSPAMTITFHPAPCTTMARESSVAVIASAGLALLCTGQGYTGHTVKTVYTSGKLGATWNKAGVPDSAGDGGTIAAASPTQLVIATASAASWLYYFGDGAAQWQTVLTEPDGGQGWADLGFTTASDGVVSTAPRARASPAS